MAEKSDSESEFLPCCPYEGTERHISFSLTEIREIVFMPTSRQGTQYFIGLCERSPIWRVRAMNMDDAKRLAAAVEPVRLKVQRPNADMPGLISGIMMGDGPHDVASYDWHVVEIIE